MKSLNKSLSKAPRAGSLNPIPFQGTMKGNLQPYCNIYPKAWDGMTELNTARNYRSIFIMSSLHLSLAFIYLPLNPVYLLFKCALWLFLPGKKQLICVSTTCCKCVQKHIMGVRFPGDTNQHYFFNVFVISANFHCLELFTAIFPSTQCRGFKVTVTNKPEELGQTGVSAPNVRWMNYLKIGSGATGPAWHINWWVLSVWAWEPGV